MDMRIGPNDSCAKGFHHIRKGFRATVPQSPILDLALFRRPPSPGLLQHVLTNISPNTDLDKNWHGHLPLLPKSSPLLPKSSPLLPMSSPLLPKSGPLLPKSSPLLPSPVLKNSTKSSPLLPNSSPLLPKSSPLLPSSLLKNLTKSSPLLPSPLLKKTLG